MAIKGALHSRKRHKRVLKLAKGYDRAKSKQYRTAKAAVIRAQASAYVGRKLKKRDFRKLWIARINAGCRQNDMSYSRFMYGLKQADINLNRQSFGGYRRQRSGRICQSGGDSESQAGVTECLSLNSTAGQRVGRLGSRSCPAFYPMEKPPQGG